MIKLVSIEGKPYWMIDVSPVITMMIDVELSDLPAIRDDINNLIEPVSPEKVVQ